MIVFVAIFVVVATCLLDNKTQIALKQVCNALRYNTNVCACDTNAIFCTGNDVVRVGVNATFDGSIATQIGLLSKLTTLFLPSNRGTLRGTLPSGFI